MSKEGQRALGARRVVSIKNGGVVHKSKNPGASGTGNRSSISAAECAVQHDDLHYDHLQ